MANVDLARIGEYRLVEHVLGMVHYERGSPLALGDDCVTHRVAPDLHVVSSTDMLVASTDVVEGMTMQQVGAKAATISISDLASKGAQPQGLLLALGIPATYTLKEVDKLLRGFAQNCVSHGARFLGGDMNEACDLIATSTAFGTAQATKLVPRSGARPGDILAVTGLFGYTGLAFALMAGKRRLPTDLPEIARQRVLNPKPRLVEGKLLARLGGATASIDSSDGLARSLYEIGKASKVGFKVTQIPIEKKIAEFALGRGLDPANLALYGGEEFELIVTVKKAAFHRIGRALRMAGGQLIPIGTVEKGSKIILVEDNGHEKQIEHKGWQHFEHR